MSSYMSHVSCHFSLYQQSKLSLTQRNGRYSAVKSSQLSRAGQYKKSVQYNFQFTLENSDVSYKCVEFGALNSIVPARDKLTETNHSFNKCNISTANSFEKLADEYLSIKKIHI